MHPSNPFRYRSIPLTLCLPMLCVPAGAALAEGGPVQLNPVEFETEGEHFRYRLFSEVQGEEMYWTITQGPDLARIHPEEDYRTGLSGREDLFVGPALNYRSYRVEDELGALVPVFDAAEAEPPHEFEDMFDNPRRLDGFRVHLTETGDTREIAGQTAHRYRFAAVTEMTNLDDDQGAPLPRVNYGTAWIFEDVPFSPAVLQPSPGMFRMAIGPGAPGGLEGYYLETLSEAFEPLGMVAELQLQSFHTSPEKLETLEAQDWALEEDQSPGQASGIAYKFSVTEFDDAAEPLDYAALENMPRATPETIEYLQTPPMLASMLDLCLPLPEDMSHDELKGMLEERATFDGSVEGLFGGPVLGQAAWGSQEDERGGDGFALATEAFSTDLEHNMCLILARVEGGLPEPGTLEVTADPHNPESPGMLAAHVVVVDANEQGGFRPIAVGQGFSGEIHLEAPAEDGTLSGHLDVEGHLSPMDDLTATEPFRYEGEFDATRIWDRVPTAR